MRLLAEVPATNLPEILARVTNPLVDGKYLHWDQLRHHQPPDGFTHGAWWSMLKIHRVTNQQALPLFDRDGQRFTYTTFPLITEQLHRIDMMAGGQIKLPEPVTNQHARTDYYVRSLIDEAITSSQIEGATTTRQIAKEMLRTGRPPRDRSERMILNNYITMQSIGETTSEPLTIALIKEIHRRVTDQSLDDPSASGRFRGPEEEVAVYDDTNNRLLHQPPPAAQLDHRTQALCDFANQSEPFVHPVIRSIILHFMIGYEHPFVDGNGRTARALFYWSMLKHGYWLAEFISISSIVLKSRVAYGMAFLQTETDEADLTYFIVYHLRIILEAIESLQGYMVHRAEEVRLADTELRGIGALNHRQRDLIRNAVRHPGRRYTVEEHKRCHRVAYETARSDLLDLADLGLLSKSPGGRGRKMVFSAQPQLAQRLATIGEGSR